MKNFMILNTTAGLIILTDEDEIDGMKKDLLCELERKGQVNLAIDHGQTAKISKQNIKDMFLPPYMHFIRLTKDCSLHGFMRLLVDIPEFIDDNRILIVSASRMRDVVTNIGNSKTPTFEKCKKVYDGLDLDETNVFEKIDELIHLLRKENNNKKEEKEDTNEEMRDDVEIENKPSDAEALVNPPCVQKRNEALTVTFNGMPTPGKRPFSDAFYRSIFFDACSFAVNESVTSSKPVVSNGVINVTLRDNIREMHVHNDHITKPYANALINEISSRLPKTNDYFMNTKNGSAYINIIKKDSFPRPPNTTMKSPNFVAPELPSHEGKRIETPINDDVPDVQKVEELVNLQPEGDAKEKLFRSLLDFPSFSDPTCTIRMTKDNKLLQALCQDDPDAIDKWNISLEGTKEKFSEDHVNGRNQEDELKKGFSFNQTDSNTPFYQTGFKPPSDLQGKKTENNNTNENMSSANVLKRKTRSVGADCSSGVKTKESSVVPNIQSNSEIKESNGQFIQKEISEADYNLEAKPKESNAEQNIDSKVEIEKNDDQVNQNMMFIGRHEVLYNQEYQPLTWKVKRILESAPAAAICTISEEHDDHERIDVNEKCFNFSGCMLLGSRNENISINEFLKSHASCIGDYKCNHAPCLYLIHCLVAGKYVLIQNKLADLYFEMSDDEIYILKSTLFYIFNCSDEELRNPY